MRKKILFLDGDGTLWYPSATKRTQKPHWIYLDEAIKDNYLPHLELTPKTKEALEHFYSRNIQLVVVSANPHDEATATREIQERLDYFGLSKLIHACRPSAGDDPNGKSAVMLSILEELRLSKEDALMVGDSYYYDYLAAKNVGIDAFFIENQIAKLPEVMPEDLQTIQEVYDLVNILQ